MPSSSSTPQRKHLSDHISVLYKEGIVHANRHDIHYIDIVNSTFHNLTKLFLSQNKIKNLHGLCQFKELKTLSLSYNLIEDFKELKYIPHSVDCLSLEGNPIAGHPNYRLMVIEQFPNLRTLDNKPVQDSERRDIIEANQLAEFYPKLLFAIDRLTSRTYKDILRIGVQVEMYNRVNNGAATTIPVVEEPDDTSNPDYKRCVKKIPPLSDLKDTKITIEGIRNLARNMFDETIVQSILDESQNLGGEMDRFRMDLKVLIVRQYRETKRYSHAVSCLEKESKFSIYAGDQTLLYILIKTMVEFAKRLFERENERERFLACLKHLEEQFPKPPPKIETPKSSSQQNSNPVSTQSSNKEPKSSENNVKKSVQLNSTPSRYANDSSKSSIEDEDTVIFSEDQLTSPDKDDLSRIRASLQESKNSLYDLEESSFFLTKSTATHYKKWNKLFSKSKDGLSCSVQQEDELSKEQRVEEFRKEQLKKKVLSALRTYAERRKEARLNYEKKRKLKNIKARSFYVKSLQSKAFSALIKNTERRRNFKQAVRILRNVRYDIIKRTFFDAWRSLLLRCSDIRPLSAVPKSRNYDSDKENRRPSTVNMVEYNPSQSRGKHYRKARPQSAGHALSRNTEKLPYNKEETTCPSSKYSSHRRPQTATSPRTRTREVEDYEDKSTKQQQHSNKYSPENVTREKDGPKFKNPKEKKEKTVLLLSAQKLDKDFVLTPDIIKGVQRGIRDAEELLKRCEAMSKKKR